MVQPFKIGVIPFFVSAFLRVYGDDPPGPSAKTHSRPRPEHLHHSDVRYRGRLQLAGVYLHLIQV